MGVLLLLGYFGLLRSRSRGDIRFLELFPGFTTRPTNEQTVFLSTKHFKLVDSEEEKKEDTLFKVCSSCGVIKGEELLLGFRQAHRK